MPDPKRRRSRTRPSRRPPPDVGHRAIEAEEARAISYRSHYVVLPQGTEKSWYDAIWPYFKAYRVTRGESLDDAVKVHGDLGHTVTAVNLSDSDVAYMRALNPDITVDRIAAATPEALRTLVERRVALNRRYGPDEVEEEEPEEPEQPDDGPAYQPRPSSTPHKLGFYVHRTSYPVELAIGRIKPRVILAHAEDVSFWYKVRQLSPDSLIIGREYVTAGDQGNFMNAPEDVGRDFAVRLLNHEISRQRVNGRPLFDAWMSFNETIPGPQPYGSPPTAEDAERYRRYDRFQVAFARRLREGGFEPVAMNFATRNWAHGRDWLTYFRGTLDTYTLLGFHEYGWPTMQGIGGATGCLDYRRIMADVRRVYGNKHLVVITEAGLARLVTNPNGGDVGWRSDTPVSAASYWDSLRWYNREMMSEAYVLGACLYQVGHGPSWETFELVNTPIMEWIADLRAESG